MFKITAYFSHSIRGDGTKTIEENMKIARGIAEYVRECVGSGLELYVPAEHDIFPQLAMEDGLLSVEQVLDIDCKIIKGCDLVLAYKDLSISKGMQVEIMYAVKHGIPIVFFDDITSSFITILKDTMERLNKE